MKKVYDLTTKSGRDKVLAVLEGINDPLGTALKYLKDFLSSNDPEKQGEVVGKLIEAERKRGAKEVEIVLENSKGGKLNIPMEGGKIDTALGTDGKIHLKVKYDNEEPIRPLLESKTDYDSQKSSALSNKNHIMSVALVLLLLIICVLVCYIIFSKQ